MSISILKQLLEKEPELELAILIGSQSTGKADKQSDWDIALQWNRGMSFVDNLTNTETLRRKLAKALERDESKIDLIDLPRAGLTMRTAVAEEGTLLKGESSLAWGHFLHRVWRELEEREWNIQHAI